MNITCPHNARGLCKTCAEKQPYTTFGPNGYTWGQSSGMKGPTGWGSSDKERLGMEPKEERDMMHEMDNGTIETTEEPEVTWADGIYALLGILGAGIVGWFIWFVWG